MASAASLAFKINSSWDGSGVRRAREDIRDLRTELRDIGNKVTAKVKVEPSMVGFMSKIREGVRGESVSVRVDPNLTGLQGRLAAAAKGKNYNIKASVVPDVEGGFGKLQARLDAMARANKVNVKVGVDYDRNSLRDLDKVAKGATESLGGLGHAATTTGISFGQLTARAAGLVGVAAAAKVAVAGVATAAFWPLISAAAQATTVLAVVPAALAGVGLVAGTVKIGLSGLGDAFKAVGDSSEDFEKAISGLAPSAQEFMRTVRGLKGAWDDLKTSVQGELFKGMSQEVQQLADAYLPKLKAGFTGIAQELNTGLLRQMEKLKDPSVGVALDDLFKNVKQAVGPATDALGDFTLGLLNIASAGSSTLPGIAQDIANIARSFKEWTANADNAQKVKDAILNGWDSLKDLSSTLWNFATVTIPAAKQAISDFGDAASRLFADSGLKSVFDSLSASAEQMAPALEQIGSSLAKAAAATGVSTWQVFLTLLQAGAGIVQALIGPLNTVASLMTSHQSLVNAAAIAWLAFKTVPSMLANLRTGMASVNTEGAKTSGIMQNVGAAFGRVQSGAQSLTSGLSSAKSGVTTFTSAWKDHVTYLQQANPAMSTASANIRTLGAAAGAAASGGLNALKGAASGLIGAFGGPWGAALAAGALAVAAVGTNSEEASAQLRALDNVGKAAAQTQHDLAAAFEKTAGAANKTNFDDITAALDKMTQSYAEAGQTAPSTMGKIGAALGGVGNAAKALGTSVFNVKGAFEALKAPLDDIGSRTQTAEKFKKMADEINNLGLSSQQLAEKMTGSKSAFDSWIAGLQSTGQISKDTADALNQMRGAVDQARNMDFNAQKVTDGLSEISAKAGDSKNDLESLRSVLEGLGLLKIAAPEAMANFFKTIDETSNAAADGVNKFAGATLDAAGQIDVTTEAGRNLQSSLGDIGEAFMRVSTSGGNMQQAMDAANKTLDDLHNATGIPIEDLKRLAGQFGLLPKEVKIGMSVDGKGEVAAALASVSLEMGKVPGTKSIRIDLPGGQESVIQLQKMGFTVSSIPGTKEVQVTAKTELAQTGLQAVLARMGELNLTEAQAKVFLETASFNLSVQDVHSILDQLNAAHADPTVIAQVSAAMGDLNLTQEELNNLNLATASPEVKAIIESAITDLAKVDGAVDTTGKKTADPKVTVDPGPPIQATKDIQAAIDGIHGTSVTVTVNEVQGTTVPRYRGGVAPGKWTGGIAGRWKGGITPKDLPGHSSGYRLPTSGPGTGTRDGFLGLTGAGMPIVRVDAGEWIINRDDSRKFDGALSALNRGNAAAAITALRPFVRASSTSDKPGGGWRKPRPVAARANLQASEHVIRVEVDLKGSADRPTMQAASDILVPRLTRSIKQGIGFRTK